MSSACSTALAIVDDPAARRTDVRLRLVRDYEAANVSEKVLRIILSYTDFVNRRVWHKAGS